MQLEWTPSQKVGPFEFGKPLPTLSEGSSLEAVPEEYHASVGWDVYRLRGRDDVRVHLEDGLVVSVSCHRECLFRTVNLIGLDLSTLTRVLGRAPDSGPECIEVVDEIQEVYEFDDLGAQVWFEGERVVTLICSAP